jgi:hypothetical protein
MVRRRATKDLLTPIPTPEKQLEGPSGFCITEHHENCPYQFNHGKCGCTCHTLSKLQKTQIIKEEISSVADSNDPRPWRKNE